MSVETRKLLSICEQLPLAKSIEVTNFSRLFLAGMEDAAQRPEVAERWLAQARGAASRSTTVRYAAESD